MSASVFLSWLDNTRRCKFEIAITIIVDSQHFEEVIELNRSGEKLNPAILARKVLDFYLKEGSLPELLGDLPPEYYSRAGVFVSLKKDGQLRGCIGTVEPVRDNLAEEIAANAVSAAVRDPRFTPVDKEELSSLSVSVDILGPMERINSEEELDPHQYGVLVRSGSRNGLLLPNLEGINTVKEQLDIARRKAGIMPGQPEELYRFKVTRYGEDA